MLATVPALAADPDTCTSGACQTAEKSWDTVRDGTKNAAHDTTQWTKKNRQKNRQLEQRQKSRRRPMGQKYRQKSRELVFERRQRHWEFL